MAVEQYERPRSTDKFVLFKSWAEIVCDSRLRPRSEEHFIPQLQGAPSLIDRAGGCNMLPRHGARTLEYSSALGTIEELVTTKKLPLFKCVALQKMLDRASHEAGPMEMLAPLCRGPCLPKHQLMVRKAIRKSRGAKQQISQIVYAGVPGHSGAMGVRVEVIRTSLSFPPTSEHSMPHVSTQRLITLSVSDSRARRAHRRVQAVASLSRQFLLCFFPIL